MLGFFSGRQRCIACPATPLAGGLHGEIDVFCRVVVNRSKTGDHMLPYLLYLQGRVGSGAGTRICSKASTAASHVFEHRRVHPASLAQAGRGLRHHDP